uniref:Uncharacterized protein n=1 Tax=Siphoviridae sp. ctP6p7 TaxID=2826319 RepID=A0A8S5M2G4_9CAUD|nr:MAG TPA: hypothetical protein [Siphoviridae sp. ctP6p7]
MQRRVDDVMSVSMRESSSSKSTRRYCFISSKLTIIVIASYHKMRQRHPEMTPPLSLALRRTSNLQNLNSLWKDELTIDTLLGHEANHTITCEELSELLEGTSTTVTDVVVAVVTEGHHVCRAKRRSIDIVAHELVRLTCDERRLPHESTVVVLESTDSCDSCIVHDKGCILSVRTLQCIDELDDILRLRSSYGLSKGTATSLSEKAKRLTVTSTVEECILLGICQSLTKLIDDVIFKTEGIIIEKFFGDLDSYMEFVRIQKDLTEGRIRKLKCAAFLNPCCSRLGRCNIDFVLAGSGNLMAQLTHDVLFIQNIDKTMVIFLRNKVAAIGIDTFLQDVGYLTEVGTKCLKHTSLIFIRSTTGLCRLLSCSNRLRSERLVYRLIELCLQCFLSFQTSDFFAKVSDFLFHSGVGCIILGSKSTFLGTVRIKKCLCSIPCSVALFTQF